VTTSWPWPSGFQHVVEGDLVKFPVSYDDIAIDIPGNEGIYIPVEDSFLLLDMLKQFLATNAEAMKDIMDPVLDMGAGGGLATLFLAKYFANVQAIDINPFATRFIMQETKRRSCANRVHVINGCLLDAIKPGQAPYYLACFNPPYLPPEDYENRGIQADDTNAFYLDAALYAPDGGRQVLTNFLKLIEQFMIPGGHVFFIKSSFSGIDNVNKLASECGLQIVDCMKVHRFFEDIEGYHAIA
jgi:methylase of polypeptide subunit release factors